MDAPVLTFRALVLTLPLLPAEAEVFPEEVLPEEEPLPEEVLPEPEEPV